MVWQGDDEPTVVVESMCSMVGCAEFVSKNPPASIRTFCSVILGFSPWKTMLCCNVGTLGEYALERDDGFSKIQCGTIDLVLGDPCTR